MEMKNPFNKKTYPNVHSGHEYAVDVVTGKILAPIYIVGTCKRYLEDVSNKQASFYFNPDKAERYLKLVQQFKHIIGVWKTPEIIYEPWQKFIWMNIMGFFNKEDNFRRFRIAHIDIPRGQGKSTMASTCLLYMLALDDVVMGNQISCVATKKEQARIVLDASRAMAKKSPSFMSEKGVKVLAHKIVQPDSNSEARALSARDDGLDGLNDVLAVMDELHAMKRETFDVIYSGMSKRKDSLTLCITTAGFDMDSVGYSQHEYAKKVCLGEVLDEQMFSAVWSPDPDDLKNDNGIFDPLVWRKVNPGWGVSVDPVTFEAKAKKAQESAADLPNFKVKHLNVWISEAQAFFDKPKWISLGNSDLTPEKFKGKRVRIGVDVASHIDLSSIAMVFNEDDKYYIFDKSYIPEDRLKQIRNTLFDNCVGSGHLIATPGEVVEQKILETEIYKMKSLYSIDDILLDPWNALSLIQNLQNKGMPVSEFRMTVANLSEATKTLDKLIRSGRVFHNGSPLLSWCLGNVVCKYDAAGNVFPKKNHEKLKIDPIIASLMAIASWLIEKDKQSRYAKGAGIRFI